MKCLLGMRGRCRIVLSGSKRQPGLEVRLLGKRLESSMGSLVPFADSGVIKYPAKKQAFVIGIIVPIKCQSVLIILFFSVRTDKLFALIVIVTIAFQCHLLY